MVLNIFSYWAEHKGRIPISKVCRRPWAPESPSSPKPTHNYRTTASVPSPEVQHSYWQYLLSVQVVTVEEEGVDRVSRASGLHRRGRDVQKVLGDSQEDSKTPGVRFAAVWALTPNTGTDPNRGQDGEFQTVIWITESKPHILPRHSNLRPGNSYEPHPLPAPGPLLPFSPSYSSCYSPSERSGSAGIQTLPTSH